MKLDLELKQGDIVLLKVLACVLIIFFSFRFLILPGFEKHQDLELEKENAEAQQLNMQQTIDSAPFMQEKIVKQKAALKEVSKGYYDLMENQEVDELITGLILKHNLFPVYLSIAEPAPGIPLSYYLTSAEASKTHTLTAYEELDGETESETETSADGSDPAESGRYCSIRIRLRYPLRSREKKAISSLFWMISQETIREYRRALLI